MNIDNKIITKLLTLLSSVFNDGIYKEMDICTEIKDVKSYSVYRLIIKGERDNNTPFYHGSMYTHIVREDYIEDEVVWAEIIYQEKKTTITVPTD